MSQHRSLLSFAPLLSRRMAFLPATDDDDELIRAINDDPQEQDSRWNLREELDPVELQNFWDNALQELRNEGVQAVPSAE